jgi:hypothetical protein
MLIQPILLTDFVDNPACLLSYGAGYSAVLFDIGDNLFIGQKFGVRAYGCVKRIAEILSIIARHIPPTAQIKQRILERTDQIPVDLSALCDFKYDGHGFFIPIGMLAQQFNEWSLIFLPSIKVRPNAASAIVFVVFVKD